MDDKPDLTLPKDGRRSFYTIARTLAHLQTFVQIAAQRRKTHKRDITSCLVIYASGALSAKGENLRIHRGHLQKLITNNNFLCDPDASANNPGWIVTPEFLSMCKVKYQITEFENIINSADGTLEDAKKIGQIINQKYNQYDAFIVLVGLDTACYMASLVSFMFNNLSKTILFTGAVIPLCYMRNDAYNNLLDSLAVVAEYDLFQVAILSKFQVFRANRSSKVLQGSFDTITSPNYSPLIQIKIDLTIKQKHLLPKPTKQMEYFDDFSSEIKVLKYHPLLTLKTLQYELNDPTVKAIVIQSYASANLPMKQEVLSLFKQAYQERELILVNISQCTYYTHISQASKKLNQYGIIYGGNMTTEAALAKLAYLIGKKYLYQDIVKLIKKDLRGELTEFVEEREGVFQQPPESFLEILEEVLPRRFTKNKIVIENTIIPALVKQISRKGTPADLRALLSLHTELSDEYLKVPQILHITAQSGNIELLVHYLNNGIKANVVDRKGCSAMYYAFQNLNKRAVYQLMKRQGQVVCPPELLIKLFADNISKDNKEFLELAFHSGYKKKQLQSIRDDEGRNIGHYCVIFKAVNCARYLKLKEVKFNFYLKDSYGNSPIEEATRLGVEGIV